MSFRIKLCAAALMLLFLPSSLAPAAAAGVFGSIEIRQTDLAPFPKWTGALERYFAERARLGGQCAEEAFNHCHWRDWIDFLEAQRDRPPAEQVAAVNAFMNSARYIVDPINWGIDDYWASPSEFFRKDGDCEDFAIAKFLSLRALGFAPETLRVVVVQDMNLRVPHAVLVVFLDGRSLVLDNQIPEVVEAGRIHHYHPVYSLNEQAWWLHRR